VVWKLVQSVVWTLVQSVVWKLVQSVVWKSGTECGHSLGKGGGQVVLGSSLQDCQSLQG